MAGYLFDDSFLDNEESIPYPVSFAADEAGMMLNKMHFRPSGLPPQVPVEKQRIVTRKVLEVGSYTIILERRQLVNINASYMAGKLTTRSSTYTVKLYMNQPGNRRRLYALKGDLSEQDLEMDKWFKITAAAIQQALIAERIGIQKLQKHVKEQVEEEERREASRPKSIVEQILARSTKLKPGEKYPPLKPEPIGWVRIEKINDSDFFPRQTITAKQFDDACAILKAAGKKPPTGTFSQDGIFSTQMRMTQSQINQPPTRGFVPGPTRFNIIEAKRKGPSEPYLK